MIGLYEEERIAYLQLVDSLIYCVSSVSSIHSITLNFIFWHFKDLYLMKCLKEYFSNTYFDSEKVKWIILNELLELLMLYDSNKMYKIIIKIKNIHLNIVPAITFLEKGDLWYKKCFIFDWNLSLQRNKRIQSDKCWII